MEYLCKACRGNLKIKNFIVLSAQKKGSIERGLVLLDSEIGNYTKTTHSTFSIKEGEEYIYTCPICHSLLNSAKYAHLVRIIMVDDDKKEYDIYFSEIAGEKCTYKLSKGEIEARGSDTNLYDKYFDIPEEDRKYL